MKARKTLSMQIEDKICFDVPKRRGVLQLGEIRYMRMIKHDPFAIVVISKPQKIRRHSLAFAAIQNHLVGHRIKRLKPNTILPIPLTFLPFGTLRSWEPQPSHCCVCGHAWNRDNLSSLWGLLGLFPRVKIAIRCI